MSFYWSSTIFTLLGAAIGLISIIAIIIIIVAVVRKLKMKE